MLRAWSRTYLSAFASEHYWFELLAICSPSEGTWSKTSDLHFSAWFHGVSSATYQFRRGSLKSSIGLSPRTCIAPLAYRLFKSRFGFWGSALCGLGLVCPSLDPRNAVVGGARACLGWCYTVFLCPCGFIIACRRNSWVLRALIPGHYALTRFWSRSVESPHYGQCPHVRYCVWAFPVTEQEVIVYLAEHRSIRTKR